MPKVFNFFSVCMFLCTISDSFRQYFDTHWLKMKECWVGYLVCNLRHLGKLTNNFCWYFCVNPFCYILCKYFCIYFVYFVCKWFKHKVVFLILSYYDYFMIRILLFLLDHWLKVVGWMAVPWKKISNYRPTVYNSYINQPNLCQLSYHIVNVINFSQFVNLDSPRGRIQAVEASYQSLIKHHLMNPAYACYLNAIINV